MSQHKLTTVYRAILKLHRSLPLELKELGDGYVKEEFRRHAKSATEGQAKIFMKEWTDYHSTLAKQLGVSAEIGKCLTPDKLEEFQENQIYQLYDLKLAAMSTTSVEAPKSENVTSKH